LKCEVSEEGNRRQCGRKDLERDVALEAPVVPAIHLAHAASTECAGDFVWSESGALAEWHADARILAGFVVGATRRRNAIIRRLEPSQKSEMSTNLDALPERVERIERKVDALSVSVDERFDQVERRFAEVDKRFDDVDRRFQEVSEHFVEQRQYTEFAFERLERRMVDGFERLERKLDQFTEAQSRRASSTRRVKKR
jgi:hypothetical protein